MVRDPPHVCRTADRSSLDLVVKAEAVSSALDWRTYWRASTPLEQAATAR